jgi:hypothetical protein
MRHGNTESSKVGLASSTWNLGQSNSTTLESLRIMQGTNSYLVIASYMDGRIETYNYESLSEAKMTAAKLRG